MSGVVNNNGLVSFSIGFTQQFSISPKVQVFANGYDMVPKLNIITDEGSNYDDPDYVNQHNILGFSIQSFRPIKRSKIG